MEESVAETGGPKYNGSSDLVLEGGRRQSYSLVKRKNSAAHNTSMEILPLLHTTLGKLVNFSVPPS